MDYEQDVLDVYQRNLATMQRNRDAENRNLKALAVGDTLEELEELESYPDFYLAGGPQ